MIRFSLPREELDTSEGMSVRGEAVVREKDCLGQGG